ncbi:PREDICTED: serine/threonine-protein kinase S6KL-like isoform X1 [Branchiostoma belcheri]|uniref:Serine/threonine-protein kinase S6KL-like isoform X1 n=1 Tax=Branchiostoma belcheri TaxID=7741 RepID=A0A6P4Y975_BRABE|nr:PREDICTED: serine/threonine-protein kinase S6KL-like isoform X1 [Branchiostoma belcheri]
MGNKVSFSVSSRHSVQAPSRTQSQASLPRRPASCGSLYSSTDSLHRKWLRASRRRRKHSTLTNEYRLARTSWPVPQLEALFLPEYGIKQGVTERDFDVIGIIAKGAFGEVLKVEKRDSKKVYAMKLMPKSEVMRYNAVQQVKDEASIQTLLGHHPFVVQVYYCWQTRKDLFLVADYIPHGDLFTIWTLEAPMQEPVVQIFAAEIALGLDFLHSAGVIYRDLKMENILLDDKRHVRLGDFGLSKWLTLGSFTRTICGTMQYMAPEILKGQPYTHACDWYSFGVLIYTLLSGRYPIEAAIDHTAMADRVAGFYFKPLQELSTPANCLVSKLMQKDPKQRLQTLEVLEEETFFQELSFEDVLARRYAPRLIDKNEAEDSPAMTRIAAEKKRHSKKYQMDDLMFHDFDWSDVNELIDGLAFSK